MNNASRYALSLLSLGLLLAGVVLLLQRMTGESDGSYAVSCSLMGFGAGFGVLAWNFGSWADGPTLCEEASDTDAEADEVKDAGTHAD